MYLTVLIFTYFSSLHHGKGTLTGTNFVVTPCTVTKYILYYYQWECCTTVCCYSDAVHLLHIILSESKKKEKDKSCCCPFSSPLPCHVYSSSPKSTIPRQGAEKTFSLRHALSLRIINALATATVVVMTVLIHLNIWVRQRCNLIIA